METIYTIDADDRALLNAYSAVDTRSGEAFADPNCRVLVEDWREIAQAEIDRHAGEA